ncbi:cytochrome oxidase assembly protein [bacterium (Candidatus Blackallbacteria) CG17_big_fil_post_rev_8_21_14_2_50_48_46]|uniref:Cytochrome oxidase assembly protein n=1 Tax=bacterium (Candidatus Blackallbacteria) CG17_big_fil_post_rev_8_21_14_2_50_48_46 TaxID=2014261 RepID=A0A2M7FXR9_9BACT|nr:MAG: cytochrome oxidase assembly protein [bacterium (Candidatus Blackallbacteria) CG18_big_fil_WC_8_21_14_2_50_49_26]PIW13972.1 MAG: cytochrome oxidase assembly protein [bacterium (Candidatus Blackallbacteria) CG17_big_fil_post_rev_8_21_14_2_50_48_46]PIW46823.1 MAG: cytochrome oxidase assembly protein [bacterium (Candidatus Blackallbacteria) CG13_big_fil_rev_8_21_14_2_50_49_14]
MKQPSPAFTRYAWGLLAFLVGVILWGAWVRISGAGAGCGNHWPTCNGVVLPIAPNTKTLIEFTHRLTSGLCLPLVLGMMIWAWKLFPKQHAVRKAAALTLFFLLSEAALGAGLVKFELVAQNTSVARAITAALHLINTFTLAATSALVAWWSAHPAPLAWNQNRQAKWPLLLAMAALIVTGMSGAVTALGDTLFPTTIFVEGGIFARLQEDLSGSTHFLVQLRLIHPILAVGLAFYLLFLSSSLRADHEEGPRMRLGSLLTTLTICQFLVGFSNILLAAPGLIQIVHLLLAVSIWLTLILLLVSVLAEEAENAGIEKPLAVTSG